MGAPLPRGTHSHCQAPDDKKWVLHLGCPSKSSCFISPIRLSPVVGLVQPMLGVGCQMKGKLLSCFVGLPVRRRKGRESLCLLEDQAQQADTPNEPGSLPSERVGTQPSHSIPSSSVTSWGSPHVGLSGARFMRRWHSQCPGGHKLDKPQTGLASG